MSRRPKATVASQSKRQGRCGTARAPIQRHRMFPSGGPATVSSRSPFVAPTVALAMGHVVSTMASLTQTRRKNSVQHCG